MVSSVRFLTMTVYEFRKLMHELDLSLLGGVMCTEHDVYDEPPADWMKMIEELERECSSSQGDPLRN